MSEKLYVGNLQERTNNFNEPEIKIGYSKEHLDLLYKNLNENGWVNVVQRTGKTGKVYQQIDTWQPKAKAATNDTDEELPF